MIVSIILSIIFFICGGFGLSISESVFGEIASLSFFTMGVIFLASFIIIFSIKKAIKEKSEGSK